ncbi:tetratricopeptide repeat protein [Nonomuraea sp. NPDC046570]|uniref:tetratricopeptide repeat protein n=1 Tax=Nonomuraea sp. NPDC046570 TaxID=3155255 RepID=UPI0033D8F9AB
MGNEGEQPRDHREWCALAVAQLNRGHPEAALESAQAAADLEPSSQWAHRMLSMALERLGRDTDAVTAAESAVRLAPGSWHARLRLGGALKRVPGRWRDASAQAALAGRYAPEEADPHVLAGDLALLRGEHARAETAYRTALRREDDHPAARVNLGLTLLRWERPRAHHDPAWPVDPRETGRARRALEVWSRQIRIVLALAVLAALAVLIAGSGGGAPGWLPWGGGAVLAVIAGLTVAQGRRVGDWGLASAMLRRDPWFGVSVVTAATAVLAYAACLTIPMTGPGGLPYGVDPRWAGPAGIVLLNGPALIVVRTLAGAWRGRPVAALAQFNRAYGERTARRDILVTLWLVLGRAWSALVVLVVVVIVVDPRTAAVTLAVPYLLMHARRRGGLGGRGAARGDRWLLAGLVLVVTAGVAAAGAGAVGAIPGAGEVAAWGWWVAFGGLAGVVPVFLLRAGRAWWRGAPGPWRASLIMCDGCGRRLPGDARESVTLSSEVRRTFTYARGVVLSCADELGPRAMAVGAVVSVSSAGELRLIAEAEAWDAAEREPRVAVFATEPLQRRFWVEVRGIALADPDSDVLRVTPKEILVGEFPGRHQRR